VLKETPYKSKKNDIKVIYLCLVDINAIYTTITETFIIINKPPLD